MKNGLLRSDASAIKALLGFDREIKLPAPLADVELLEEVEEEDPAVRKAGEDRIRGCSS